MRFSPNEFRELLIADPELRVLVVEGDFDLRLWRRLIPDTDRKAASIIPIGAIEVTVSTGGNKARALALAEIAVNWPEATRLRFFVDRDYDPPIARHLHSSVIETDGRDIESYLLLPNCLDCFCEIGEKDQPDLACMRDSMDDMLLPVAFLRIASQRNGWFLPFQATLSGDSLKRFFVRKRGRLSIDIDALRQSLISSASIYLLDEQVVDQMEYAKTQNTATSSHNLIHGKDLFAYLSWIFKVPLDIVTALFILSLASSITSLLERPRFRAVYDWIKA